MITQHEFCYKYYVAITKENLPFPAENQRVNAATSLLRLRILERETDTETEKDAIYIFHVTFS